VAVRPPIKVFNWTATLYRGSITFQAPMLYALGFIALFTVGGVTGLFLSTMGTDRHLHDTYFVIAHFSLYDGRRHGHGVFRGISLLLAEDDG